LAHEGTREREVDPIREQSLLDTPTPRFVNRTLLALTLTAGRIAQRESVPFTRERSKVRSLVRPPYKALRLQGFFILPKSSNMQFLTFRDAFSRLDAPKIRPMIFRFSVL
jgi:hypothetical protein